MWVSLLVPVNSLAAVFCTACCLFSIVSGRPTKRLLQKAINMTVLTASVVGTGFTAAIRKLEKTRGFHEHAITVSLVP